jgi:outer membrane protein
MQKILIILIAWSCAISAQAQDASQWTLERCIDYAQKNNISVKQGEVTVRNNELNLKQTELSRYPTVDASTSAGLNFGRSIDRTTNVFQLGQSGFNSISISAGGVIYNGGRINNTILQNKLDRDASKADQEQIIQDLALNVATNYLQILLAEEQLLNTQKRVEQGKSQLSQMDKLIQAGTRPQNDRLDILAQIARNDQAVVAAQNNLDLSYLNLKQVMQLDPSTDMKVSKPNINIPTGNDLEGLTLNSVFSLAIGRQPQIKAGELRQKSSEIGVRLARSGRLPSISWFGNLGTNYSSLARDFKAGVFQKDVPRQIKVLIPPNTVPTVITTFSDEFTSPTPVKSPYFSQLGDNFGQGIGISISVPIYDQGRTNINEERARLNTLNVQLGNQLTQNRLKNDIQVAIANARAAKKQYEASEKAAYASKIAYENIEKKFKVGASNTFELTTAKNTWDSSETDQIVAKYDYIFKLKVVDFYQGKRLILN